MPFIQDPDEDAPESSNATPALLEPPNVPEPPKQRTNKHKVRPSFADAHEPPVDFGFHDAVEATETECRPTKRGPG